MMNEKVIQVLSQANDHENPRNAGDSTEILLIAKEYKHSMKQVNKIMYIWHHTKLLTIKKRNLPKKMSKRKWD